MSNLVFALEKNKEYPFDEKLERVIKKRGFGIVYFEGKVKDAAISKDVFVFATINSILGGVFLDGYDLFYNFSFEYYHQLISFKDISLNPNGMACAFLYLKESKWDIFNEFAREAKIFIRPNLTFKEFSGQLVDIQDFDNFIDDVEKQNPTINKYINCFVSSPKEIRAEWRLICSKKEIITGSLYLYQGLRSLVKGFPPGVAEIAQKVIAKSQNLPNLYVVDVCLTEDGEYKLIELNPINSAGLYECDREKIVDAIISIYDNGSRENKVSG